MRYQVLVGNIGVVFESEVLKQAIEYFKEYKQQSKTCYGRAAGEDVCILRDYEPMYAYDFVGRNSDDDEGVIS